MGVVVVSSQCVDSDPVGTGRIVLVYTGAEPEYVYKFSLLNSNGDFIKELGTIPHSGGTQTSYSVVNGSYKIGIAYNNATKNIYSSSVWPHVITVNCFNTLVVDETKRVLTPALDNGTFGSATIVVKSQAGTPFATNYKIEGYITGNGSRVWEEFTIDPTTKTFASRTFENLVGGATHLTIRATDLQPEIPYDFVLPVEVAPVKVGDQLSFLPWVKHKLGRVAIPPDLTPTASLRPTLPLKLSLGVTDGSKPTTTETVTVQAELYGPGDVIGLNPTAVLRTTPSGGEQRFSPLQVASIEFGEEDLPWRYTPEAISNGGHLRPWCFLLVLEENEFVLPTQGNTPLPLVEVAAGVPLPTPSQLWLWAHVQVNRVLADTKAVDDFLAGPLLDNPALAFSRIFSPRRLKQNTRYHAFLLPTYEAGRQAGMGGKVTAENALTLAWPEATAGKESYELLAPKPFPIYHQWDFQTGEGGDFESLARLMQPTTEELTGANTLALQLPGATTGTTNSYTLQLPGVLEPWDATDEPLSTAVAGDMYRALEPGLQPRLVSVSGRPVVVPPVYGQAYMANAGEEVAEPDTWQRQVNVDPRYRAIAGLGSQLIQDQQEEYLGRAWEQVKDIAVANQNLRSLQVGLEASSALRRQHLPIKSDELVGGIPAPEDPGTISQDVEPASDGPDTGLANYGLQLTGLALPRVRLKATGLSARETIRRSNVPLAAFSPTFRRLLRPLGPYQVNLAGRPLRPSQEEVGSTAQDPLGPGTSLRQRDELLSLLQSGQVQAASSKPALIRAYQFNDLAVNGLLADQTVVPSAVYVYDAQGAHEVTDTDSLGKFRTAFSSLRSSTRFRTEDQQQPPLDLSGLKSSVAAGTDPERVLVARAKRALLVVPRVYHGDFDSRDFVANDFVVDVPLDNLTIEAATGASSQQTAQVLPLLPAPAADTLRVDADSIAVPPIKPVQTYPVFKDALGEQLRKRHPELLLPGLADFPQNSVAVMKLNRAFIEAFLLGANHAFGSELAWREFPVDLQGSFFRQFWDVTDYLQTQPVASATIGAVAAREEQLRDVTPLHEWGTSELGAHPNHSTTARIVLVIRAELLQRFPTTVIAAQPATTVSGEKVPDPDATLTRYPMYRLPIGQDVVALAFDLTITEAANYFFTFSQRPSEPQFGLDKLNPIPATIPPIRFWNDLSWEYLDVKEGENLQIDPAGKPSPTSPNETVKHIRTSADLAYALFQQPVMVAVPAQRIL